MNEQNLPCPAPAEPEAPSVESRSRIRVRLRTTRDRVIHEAATRLIRLGQDNPRLRNAGYWLYGAATRYLPRGKEVAKLGEVGENVLRGAQPSLRAFRTLRELGVDTVINLRPECDRERPLVEQLGMRYFYMPLPPLAAPTLAVTIEFLSVATDPANGKVFFHCFHGVDRTGTMAACLRIARDGWSVDQALDEMRAFKVHEQGQRAKVDFLAEFHAYWNAQPLSFRCEVLHLPLPEPAEEPATVNRPWWSRAGGWVKQTVGKWLPALHQREG